jgi:hypothetical protein
MINKETLMNSGDLPVPKQVNQEAFLKLITWENGQGTCESPIPDKWIAQIAFQDMTAPNADFTVWVEWTYETKWVSATRDPEDAEVDFEICIRGYRFVNPNTGLFGDYNPGFMVETKDYHHLNEIDQFTGISEYWEMIDSAIEHYEGSRAEELAERYLEA